MPKYTQIHIPGHGDVQIIDEHRQNDESQYDHRMYVEAISTPSYNNNVEQDIKGTVRV